MLASSWRRLLASALAGSSLACAHNPAPRGWLTPAKQAQADPYGAWLVLWRVGGGPAETGEFLAAEGDSVFVLSSNGEVRALLKESVLRAEIWFYDSQMDALAGWTLIGSLSTASHGIGAIVSLPVWIIAGSLATRRQSLAPLRQIDRADSWADVRMYARFPAGLPANLPRALPPKAQHSQAR